VVLERVDRGGFLGFELGADGSGGMELYLPAGGSRKPASSETVAAGEHFARMNGREVFKFATRVLVSSANALLDEVGLTVEDVDVYVPHQANIRIITHAADKLGIPDEKVVVNVDRYGNTSSGSIPLALADAVRDGRLRDGRIVLMTGMGAGLTWGSGVMEWTTNGVAA
jgi:3-oxoacyl-[acyl-carrier-protein] synthase-3